MALNPDSLGLRGLIGQAGLLRQKLIQIHPLEDPLAASSHRQQVRNDPVGPVAVHDDAAHVLHEIVGQLVHRLQIAVRGLLGNLLDLTGDFLRGRGEVPDELQRIADLVGNASG